MPKRKWDGLVVDGAELRGKCSREGCCKKEHSIFEFCPVDDGKRAKFDQAVEDYEIAATDGEVELAAKYERAVRGLMRTWCAHHRAIQAKSQSEHHGTLFADACFAKLHHCAHHELRTFIHQTHSRLVDGVLGALLFLPWHKNVTRASPARNQKGVFLVFCGHFTKLSL
jgi:hypothetical protein